MCRNLSLGMKKNAGSIQSRLTEENLRLHSSAHIKNDCASQSEEEQPWARQIESFYQFDDEFDESDDEDVDARMNNIALRRAASLEALKAYGGCFASGFFAMQQPLPWTSNPTLHSKSSYEDTEGFDIRRLASDMPSVETGSVRTSSSRWYSNPGNPRPDSDTLSHADVQEITTGRKWSWRDMGRSRRSAAHKSGM